MRKGIVHLLQYSVAKSQSVFCKPENPEGHRGEIISNNTLTGTRGENTELMVFRNHATNQHTLRLTVPPYISEATLNIYEVFALADNNIRAGGGWMCVLLAIGL